jgi:mRNA-degrading endonuclease RelE of RelBE toxin-antitoxin system
LSGMSHPQYRLRIGEIRVFYDVDGQRVEILAIILKSEAAAWLESMGGKK